MKPFKTIHTSRTIVFVELQKVMDYAIENNNFADTLNQNVTRKKTQSGQEKTTGYLKCLYGFDLNEPSFQAFRYFWTISDVNEKPLLSFIYAINHDTILEESISIVHETPVGEKVTVDHLEENIEKYHPCRYSKATRRSMAQNIGSSWKQAGFIVGKVKNIRTQPGINYRVACFAYLLAYLKGARGEFVWNNSGVKSLCLNEIRLRELAIECAKRDLMQYQYAGSVTAITFNDLLNKIGINAI
ncbi:MAG: hypothetical protein WCI31_09655 [Prolixibacteraceae bacterium]